MQETILQRVTLDMPKDLAKKLKIACAKQEISIRKMVIEAIEEKLEKLKSK